MVSASIPTLYLACAAASGGGSAARAAEERSRAEARLLQDEVAALREQLASTSTQLAQARAASVNLRFLRLGAGDIPDHSTTGFADATGAFTVPKVRAGRYRIAVIHLNGRQPGDQLGGRFDERKSKIIREFTGETKDLLIDLAQPEVEKPAGS